MSPNLVWIYEQELFVYSKKCACTTFWSLLRSTKRNILCILKCLPQSVLSLHISTNNKKKLKVFHLFIFRTLVDCSKVGAWQLRKLGAPRWRWRILLLFTGAFSLCSAFCTYSAFMLVHLVCFLHRSAVYSLHFLLTKHLMHQNIFNCEWRSTTSLQERKS